MNTDRSREAANFILSLPIAACEVDSGGIIIKANAMMKHVFAYNDIVGSNFFAITGAKIDDILAAGSADEEESLGADADIYGEGARLLHPEVLIWRNERCFSLHPNVGASKDRDIAVLFFDVTEREELRIKNRDEQLCMMYVNIDNYDELMATSAESDKLAVPARVDMTLRDWAERNEASIEDVNESGYQLTLYRKDADAIIERKFDILDEVRKVETKTDFPVSVSIGMGMEAGRPDATMELASAALDLAMGRGGDQAVVKDGEHTHYYGGTLQSVEKSNKGKSRVISHAMKNLIKESRNVFIMGHRLPDMDSFGAAVGAYRMTQYQGKDAYIVIGEHNEALNAIYDQAIKTEEYTIISRRKAIEMCGERDLVIIVDTARPSLVECPELMEQANRMVVIDHHRLSDDAIKGATLSYVESYASSASELMTEIIQYSASKRIINKFEAEALLAGITVDTNSFSIKTGVRTFEAAAWLRRAGADTTEVKRFFQTDITSFKARASAIAEAEYLDCGIALSVSEDCLTEAQIVNAQVADSLLSVKGIQAAFAIGMNARCKTVISGRSLGGINVQVILEKFGGGGHLTSAGAQVDESPQEVLEKLKQIFKEMFDNDTEKGKNRE